MQDVVVSDVALIQLGQNALNRDDRETDGLPKRVHVAVVEQHVRRRADLVTVDDDRARVHSVMALDFRAQVGGGGSRADDVALRVARHLALVVRVRMDLEGKVRVHGAGEGCDERVGEGGSLFHPRVVGHRTVVGFWPMCCEFGDGVVSHDGWFRIGCR